MPLQVPPAPAVIIAVFVAWSAGTLLFAAMTRLSGEVQPGHFKVVWLVGAGMGVVAGLGFTPAFLPAALALGTFLAIYRRRDREAGIASAAAGLAVLVAAGLWMHGGGWPLVGFLAATAWLLGAVTNAMLLGHWHLNQPRLGIAPIKRLVHALWGGLAAFLAAAGWLFTLALGLDDVAVMGAVTAVVFGVFSGVLTAMITHLVRIRSIQSATGILYLEILLCFVCAFTGVLGAMSLGS